ncbi:hypothetical protein IQ230_09665 [Gloeocapsopsis crepidinum LEGE 06123]|uniref:Uncharacterized protein n=1 Tax=Gloeocapsopsis crepidinum LEGE 06123 TaxID=588587 RepID=A0ABR9UQR3_9CHRO|nr:hypothetical protein [Gloeocapsopsis crepidinum]MBE9190623.1 hypothetical protein [Gloeocapsopsis crepidinum LEGE 06123]
MKASELVSISEQISSISLQLANLQRLVDSSIERAPTYESAKVRVEDARKETKGIFSPSVKAVPAQELMFKSLYLLMFDLGINWASATDIKKAQALVTGNQKEKCCQSNLRVINRIGEEYITKNKPTKSARATVRYALTERGVERAKQILGVVENESEN